LSLKIVTKDEPTIAHTIIVDMRKLRTAFSLRAVNKTDIRPECFLNKSRVSFAMRKRAQMIAMTARSP
jgi:hypothetical protein